MKIVERFFELTEPGDALANAGALPLFAYFGHHAVVILGGPGLGKTTEFELAASLEPNAGCYSVSDFLHFPTEMLQGKTIYLDALDEHRAEVAGQSVMSAIVGKLLALGSPKVRLSCRDLEWHEGSDVRALGKAALGELVCILKMRPLLHEDIKTIAAEQINDVEAFLDGAKQRDLEETLSNPENLKLYLKVYKGSGGWPETRTDLMEQSVRLLLREENEQHARVRGDKVADERLLAAAEDLSAIHVFSDAEGFALSKAVGKGEGHIPIQELTDIDHDAAGVAARRKLFASTGAECVKPQHKTTGDFLAANALARRIHNGQLSLGRALSLIVGKDGGTLSHLRDVYAWLIALLPKHSQRLLRADPFGAMVYGDAAQWSVETKRAALNILREYAAKDDPWFRAGQWNTPLLGGLACKDMVEDFRNVLHNEEDSHLVSVVLSALEHGAPQPELGDDLLAFVRNASRPKIRWLKDNALSAFVINCPGRIGELKDVLNEVHSGVIRDDDLEMRTELLRLLYPSVISPDQAVEYFIDSDRTNLISFGYYLSHQMLEHTPDDELSNLAQAMINKTGKVGALSKYDAKRMAGALLVRLITVHGDTASVANVYDWLGLHLDECGHSSLDGEHVKFIKAYIEGRDGFYEALYRHWLAHAKPDKDGFWSEYKFGYRVLHAAKPTDFCTTLLSIAEGETDQPKADLLFTEAAGLVMHAEPGSLPVTWEDLFSFVDRNPRFHPTWDKSLCCNLYDRYFEYKLGDRKHKDARDAGRLATVKILSDQLEALRAGKAIQNLDLGAKHWFGYSLEASSDNPPFERIAKATNEKIATAMVVGFEALLKSDEQHTPMEIAELCGRSRHYYVTYPILVGADIVAERAQEEFLVLPDENLKAALTYRLLFPGDRHPLDWDDWIYAKRPELGVAVLEDIWRAELKGGKTQHLTGLYIGKTEDPATPLVLAVISKILRETPTLSSEILREMLTTMLRHGDHEVLRDITLGALKGNALRGEKHTLWLAMATLFDSQTYADKLERKVRKNARDMWAAYFILMAGAGSLMNGTASAPQLQVAISILGKLFRDKPMKNKGFVRGHDKYEDATREINGLINTLSGLPTEEAAQAFENLCADPALHEWHNHLRHARTLQAKNMRDKTFVPLAAVQVCKLLAGGASANMQDMQAIALDILDDIAPTIHGANTNRWKKFWRLGDQGKPERPNIENDCRDVLLDMMRSALEVHGITSEPEAQAANEKRADIRLTESGAGTLPIEAKRASDPDVWTAMEEQLVPRYTNDPKTEGRGIFLVFWFGTGKLAGPPKSLGIPKPKTAAELHDALEAIKPNERIEVRVMDVSKPHDD